MVFKLVSAIQLVSSFLLVALVIAFVTNIVVNQGSLAQLTTLSRFFWAGTVYFLFALNILRIVKARLNNGKVQNTTALYPQVAKTSRIIIAGLIISCLATLIVMGIK